MKKLLFGLIATIMFGFVGNANEVTKEQARKSLATSMSELVKDLTPYYKQGMPYDDFIKDILIGGTTGPTFPIPTQEGNSLLKKAHELLSSGFTTQNIIDKYDGVEMAAAAKLIQDSKTSYDAGVKLFGEKFMKESKYGQDAQKMSKWPPKWLGDVLTWIWDNHTEIITILCMFIPC